MEWVHVPVTGYPQKLYLGNVQTAVNYKFLQENNIKFIISLDNSWEDNRQGLAKIYNIHLYNRYFDDSESPEQEWKVRSISQEVSRILHSCLQKGNTYIHCQAGINRSPLCVATFLIQYQRKSPQEAIDYLKELNRTYRSLPCLYNELFVQILGGQNDQIKKFRIFMTRPYSNK